MNLKIELLQAIYGYGRFQKGPLQHAFEGPGLHLIRGENGSGKTSLMKCILGRLKTRSGEILKPTGKIAFVGIENFLMQHWTLEENFNWLQTLLSENLQSTHWESLHTHKFKRVNQLSLGLKRQFELALALATSCPILLFDEPLNSLDASKRETFRESIHRASAHKLILLTSHESGEWKPKGILDL